jgi:hypothetical protein
MLLPLLLSTAAAAHGGVGGHTRCGQALWRQLKAAEAVFVECPSRAIHALIRRCL